MLNKTKNVTSKKTLNLPPSEFFAGGKPSDEEVAEAGIDLEVWKDSELWDDREKAFFWQHRARYHSAEDERLRVRLAQRLHLPASWNFLLPFIERLCGTIHEADKIAVREWKNWREKVVFADLRDAFPNCEHVIEIARNAQVAAGDVVVSTDASGVFRVIFSETVNDQTFCFLMEI